VEKEHGSLSINSENILPIIKKWLYSDSDIFIRELVSNAADAITKLRKISDIGEVALPEGEKFAIRVTLDKGAGTVSVEDNGIGMTADEVRQYINQIAFSGASDFVEKYKDKLGEGNDIIGHFGLGFYSAFMVADKVQIDTLSYQEGAQAARWTSDGTSEYQLEDSPRDARGTLVTLHMGEGGAEFLDPFRMRQILRKYCAFVPENIYFADAADGGNAAPANERHHEHDKDHDDECGCGEEHEPEAREPEPINDPSPLWLKNAAECTDEEYKAFYHDVFSDFNDPLFWIHLNMDYPFRLKGILYFPKLKHELESIEGQVKLYSNQIFIADNIKEVIPEFLLLLKGTLDCPDLPLNVSRSFLQNDGYVTKMSAYITRKVADKLNTLHKNERDQYNSYWEDISPFIKYGCIRDKDFYEKLKGSLVYKTIGGDFVTLEEYKSEELKGAGALTVYYVTDERQQAQYVRMFKDNGLNAVILDTNIDNPFVSYIESYEPGVRFKRIDADISDALKSDQKAGEELAGGLTALFKDVLGNDIDVSVENLKSDYTPAVMLLSEESRRMSDMSKMFGSLGLGSFEEKETLVLNSGSGLVRALLALKDQEGRRGDVELICRQIYDLAYISHRPLPAERMAGFIERSNKIMELLAGTGAG